MSILSWEEFRERSIWEYELKIDPADLKLGHFVRLMSIPWEETNFPLQGVLVDSFDTKRWFQAHCDWVVIDLDRSTTQYRPAHFARHGLEKAGQHVASEAIHLLRRSNIDRETLQSASSDYGKLDEQAERLIRDLIDDREIDAAGAGRVVEELADGLNKNVAALVWLSRIKQRDRYTAQHCINVAILCMGVAASLDWSREDIEMAGLAGLLHDLGKMRLDLDILNKPGRLTPEEFEHVKQHTVYGRDMLRPDRTIPEKVVEAALTHHERPDGQGYPHGLSGEQISPLARLVAIIDAYDAITSNRVYDPARSHHEALGILWKNRETQFDKELVESLTQFMGWVTPGTLVRLSNDELAIVLEAPSTRGFLPLVRLLYPENGAYRMGQELDLAGQRAAGVVNPVRVAEVLPDGYADIDVRDLSEQLSGLIPD